MDNLLVLPSPHTQDANVAMADWAELACIFSADGGTSREDVIRAVRRDSGLSDVQAQSLANDVFKELADRLAACLRGGPAASSGYPFLLERDDTYLRLRESGPLRRWQRGFIYLFLLIMTRASMSSSQRTMDGIDPTKTFEQLCADVLAAFWGGASHHSGAMVFGTAARSSTPAKSFRSKVEKLCEIIGEGGGWKDGAVAPGGGDGKLDVVAWRRFEDGRRGGLVGFAQCKTGNSWDKHLTQLNPRTFCRNYMQQDLVLEPVRIYMVPNRISLRVWESHTSDGGILFDRCRILQYAHPVNANVLEHLRRWMTAAVAKQQRLMIRTRRRS